VGRKEEKREIMYIYQRSGDTVAWEIIESVMVMYIDDAGYFERERIKKILFLP
jgi:hypothetical protein